MKTQLSLLLLTVGILAGLEALSQPHKSAEAPVAANQQTHPTTEDRLAAFYSQGIQEKLYIQTDKPYYSAGDTLWFRGFLVDAATMRPLFVSRYIYVEMIDPSDSVVYRAKIRGDEQGFHNSLKIATDLPEGDYTLRAYTRWMQNAGDDFFFQKRIPVGNKIDDNIITSVTYGRDEDRTITASIRVCNMNHDPIVQQRLSYEILTDGKVRKSNARTDDNGQLILRFSPPAQDTARNMIRLTANDNNLQFKKTLFLPAFSEKFDVQFFPESGRLLPSETQTVAFKAIGANGLGIEVQGRLFNSRNEEITSFASRHKGMGRFAFQPQPEERYHAEITNPSGGSIRVDLPPVETSGAGLQAVLDNDRILCRIHITDDLNPAGWQLIVLNRDKIIVREDIQTRKAIKGIPLNYLQPGIVQLALVDTLSNKRLCERLLFIPKRDSVAYQLSTDRANYKKRQKVEVQLSVVDSQATALEGDFAVSVTDREIVRRDSTSGNILSHLLLTSDLKGYIEDPGYYCLDNSPQRLSDLDLLMLTQGWTRYAITDKLGNTPPAVKHPVEWSQSITGKITGMFGNTIKRPIITLLVPEQNYAEIIELNPQKEFKLDGMTFPDSTVLVLQATNDKSWIRGISLKINPDSFPAAKTFTPIPHINSLLKPIPDDYLDVAKQKYYDEGGTRVIDMKSITVTAKSREEQYLFDNIRANRLIDAQIMEHFKNQSLYQALTFMGFTVRNNDNGEKILTHNSDAIPLAMLNGRRFVRAEEVLYSTVGTYETIGILSPQDAKSVMIPIGLIPKMPVGSTFRKGPGLLLLKLKEGMALEDAFAPPPLASKVVISPLGYKKPEAFYQPKYDVPDVLKKPSADRRTTVYWTPSIRTDADGRATFSFYTADRKTTYDVVLEGITDNGKICRYTTTIDRNEE